jgi:hypothetical protein
VPKGSPFLHNLSGLPVASLLLALLLAEWRLIFLETIPVLRRVFLTNPAKSLKAGGSVVARVLWHGPKRKSRSGQADGMP